MMIDDQQRYFDVANFQTNIYTAMARPIAMGVAMGIDHLKFQRVFHVLS